MLFTLLIATIFLPSAVTIVPTYTMFVKLGWVGTWLPLLVPTFFANAYDVFLLRQYLLTIPREMDEAAAIDGAGPFRTLVSVILPQAWPVDHRGRDLPPRLRVERLLRPADLPVDEARPPAARRRASSGSTASTTANPAYVQAGTLMTMVIPVILFLVFQRVFTRGVVVTGVEK